ncbi:MAG: hypothetical protein V7629_17355 [Motiliproteus sp.]
MNDALQAFHFLRPLWLLLLPLVIPWARTANGKRQRSNRRHA